MHAGPTWRSRLKTFGALGALATASITVAHVPLEQAWPDSPAVSQDFFSNSPFTRLCSWSDQCMGARRGPGAEWGHCSCPVQPVVRCCAVSEGQVVCHVPCRRLSESQELCSGAAVTLFALASGRLQTLLMHNIMHNDFKRPSTVRFCLAE